MKKSSSSLRYFCKENKKADILKKTHFYLSLSEMSNSASVMNTFVFTVYLILAPPVEEERASETIFLTVKGLKVLILIMFYEHLKNPFSLEPGSDYTCMLEI